MKRRKVRALLIFLSCALICLWAAAQNIIPQKNKQKANKVNSLTAITPATVVDLQGLCSIRPKMGRRWTYSHKGMRLAAGDWLRTDISGANALQLKLSQGHIICGPGSLLEIIVPNCVAVSSGEVEIHSAAGIKARFPGKKEQIISATQRFRVAQD